MTDVPEVLVSAAEPGVAVVSLNRPERRNALGWQSWTELGDALTRIRDDDGCRAVVLTGVGGTFCSGGDVTSSPSAGRGVGAPAARLLVGQRVLTALLQLPKPVVAAVEGAAAGVGLSLALACDLVVAAADAVLLAPFAQRGLVPDGGAAWFLVRAVGRQRAAELLLLGERWSAAQAGAAGLVNRVVDPGEALSTARSWAARLAAGSADALSLTKGMLRGALDVPFERFLELEWVTAALELTGPDALEGRTAFTEKRHPVFWRPPS